MVGNSGLDNIARLKENQIFQKEIQSYQELKVRKSCDIKRHEETVRTFPDPPGSESVTWCVPR